MDTHNPELNRTTIIIILGGTTYIVGFVLLLYYLFIRPERVRRKKEARKEKKRRDHQYNLGRRLSKIVVDVAGDSPLLEWNSDRESDRYEMTLALLYPPHDVIVRVDVTLVPNIEKPVRVFFFSTNVQKFRAGYFGTSESELLNAEEFIRTELRPFLESLGLSRN